MDTGVFHILEAMLSIDTISMNSLLLFSSLSYDIPQENKSTKREENSSKQENLTLEEEMQELQEALSKVKDSSEDLKQEDEENLTAVLEEGEETLEDEDTIEVPVNVEYSFHEEEFIASLYSQQAVDYEKMWYGETQKAAHFEQEQEYITTEQTLHDTKSEMMTNQEAQDAFAKVQYSAIMGTVHDVDPDTRRKLHFWAMFNPALFKLMETTSGLTRNYNIMM